MNGFPEKCKKPQFLGQMAEFRPNLGQFWPKWAIFEISQKKRKRHFFSTPESKKLGKSDARFSKKMQKTSILGILGQKGQFWTVFGQNGENGQKSAWNIFPNF